MHTRLIPFVRAAATVAVVAGTMLASAASAQVCPYNSTQGTCACPTAGAGTTCFGGQLYRASDNSCQNDVRPCAANQNWNCATTSCVCNTASFPCGGCTGPTSAPGGACSSPAGGQYTNVCGACACPAGTTLCSSSNTCVTNLACPAGTTFNPCTNSCETPNVLLSPSWVQSGYVQISGDVRSTAGDFYLANGKAVRVDATGTTQLNLGNWGSGATGFNARVFGGFVADGNVGIGTASPATKLHVSGGHVSLDGDVRSTDNAFALSTRTSGVDRNRVEFSDNDVRVGTYLNNMDVGSESLLTIEGSENSSVGNFDISGLAFSNDSNRAGQTSAPIAKITAFTDATVGTNNGGLRFFTKDGTTLVDRLTISQFGNVGIGTSTPADGRVEIVRPNTSNRNAIVFGTGANNDWEIGQIYADNRFSFKAITSQPIVGPMIMQLDPVGRVGINMESPTEALDVFGKVKSLSLQVTTGAAAGRVLTSDASGNATWQAPTGITGSGTANYVTKFTGATSVANSQIFDNGTNVGVGTTAPGAKFQVNDGSVLFTGTTGAIPATGAGTRMMWYPGKSAFRAGLASGPNWDDVNVGTSSAAVGADTRAGNYSFAAGNYSYATGTGSAAFGQSSGASGDYSLAAGYSTTATGLYSAAFGYASTAGGSMSFATGQGTASGAGSVAMGQYTNAANSYAQAYGSFTEANGYKSVTLGSGFDGTAGGKMINNTGYAIMLGTHSSLPTMTVYNGAPGIGSTGEVGIGLGAAMPTDKLAVVGNDITSQNVISAKSNSVSAAGNVFYGEINNNNVSNTDFLEFQSGSTLSEKLRVSGSGQWILRPTNQGTNGSLWIMLANLANGFGTPAGLDLQFTDNTTGTGGYTALKVSAGFSGAGSGTKRLAEFNAGANGVVIDSAGSVGVGTASPAYDMDVVGNVQVSGGIGAGGLSPSSSYGIRAQSTYYGGYFTNTAYNSYAYAPYWDYGIYAGGPGMGGYFYDTDNYTYAYNAYGGYSFYGGGVFNNNGDMRLEGKHAFRGTDSWLRLNQDGAFSSGTHTPGNFAPGALNVGGANGWGNPGGGNAWIAGNMHVYGTITSNYYYNWYSNSAWNGGTSETNRWLDVNDYLCAMVENRNDNNGGMCRVWRNGSYWWTAAYSNGSPSNVACVWYCWKFR